MSNMGFIISTHFCGGEAVFSNVGIEQEHLSCGMISTPQECEFHSSLEAGITKDCCDNKYISSSISDDYISISNNFESKIFVDLIGEYLSIQLFKFEEIEKACVAFYSPPYLSRDLSVLFQTFLI